jgi:hypothetical protein
MFSEAFKGVVDLVSDGGGHASYGGELFGAHQGAFGEAALGDVAEDEDDADEFALTVANGGSAVIDADLGSIFRDEEGVIGEAYDGSEAAYFVDGTFDDGPGLFVEDTEDLVEIEVASIRFRPACEVLSDRVHKDDSSALIAGDDSVADAAKCCVEPLFASKGLLAATASLIKLEVVDACSLPKETLGDPGDEAGRDGCETDEKESCK